MSAARPSVRRLLGTRRQWAYRAFYHSMLLHRRLTAGWRREPDFLIIGAQKCGTSSLYAYLVRHPQVLAAFKKEVGYFNRYYHRGAAWYRAFFPHRGAEAETARLRRITGEATPDYLFHGGVPRRVAALLPNVKIIVMLRDPVRRAFSHYYHNVRFGFERRTFEQAIEAELRVLEAYGVTIAGDEAYTDPERRRFSYLARGHYLQQLEAWAPYFPINSILLIRSEDMFRDPAATYAEVLTYLGVNPTVRVPFEIHNEGSTRGRITAEMEERLRLHFAPHNRALFQRIGRDLGW